MAQDKVIHIERRCINKRCPCNVFKNSVFTQKEYIFTIVFERRCLRMQWDMNRALSGIFEHKRKCY